MKPNIDFQNIPKRSVICSIKAIVKKIIPKSMVRWIKQVPPYIRNESTYFTHRHDISQVMEMVADDLSRETLSAYMKLQRYGNVTPLKCVTRPSHKQYFDETVLTPDADAVFVDMGSLDGSTSIQFAEWVDMKYKGIILFEPDKLSYQRSKENILHLENTIIYNEGASDFCGQVFFTDTGTGGSCISDLPTETKINVSTLDSKINEIPFVPTHIKMDIEGVECAALHGCAETIKKYKPILMISAYHKISDIWKIPFIMKQLNPQYKIYFRHYNVSIEKSIIEMGIPEEVALHWELVCYAL